MALAERTLDLVNIPSESGREAELYRYVTSVVPLEQAFADGETVIFAKRSGKPLVLLAGHTDTVPAQGNLPGRIEDGSVVGLGASDMKGGLAVMIELARWAAETELGLRPRRCSSSRGRSSARPRILSRACSSGPASSTRQRSSSASSRPTTRLQLGCLGNLNAEHRLRGAVGALGAAMARRERDRRRARRAAPRS